MYNYTINKYSILKTEIDYLNMILQYNSNQFTETFYKKMILENVSINIINSTDNLIYTKHHQHGTVKVINIIKFIIGKIKIDVMKYSISTVFQNPILSGIIQIFYSHEIIPMPSLISIDQESIEFKCFSYSINGHKSIILTLLHSTYR